MKKIRIFRTNDENPEFAYKKDHKIWSWSKQRREAEIKKCVVLCRKCHVKAHVEMGTYRGENQSNSKLTNKQVIAIKKRLKRGDKQTDIAADYGVTNYCINKIAIGKSWTHITI